VCGVCVCVCVCVSVAILAQGISAQDLEPRMPYDSVLMESASKCCHSFPGSSGPVMV